MAIAVRGWQASCSYRQEQTVTGDLTDCGKMSARCAQSLSVGMMQARQLQHHIMPTRRQFSFGDSLFAGNPADQKHWTLPEIVERMRAAYCDTLAVEFDHLPSQ